MKPAVICLLVLGLVLASGPGCGDSGGEEASSADDAALGDGAASSDATGDAGDVGHGPSEDSALAPEGTVIL